jgi:hypothetical protein
MTTIQMLFGRPASGTVLPVAGTVTWTPTRVHIVAGDPDLVVLPLSFTVTAPKVEGATAPIPFSAEVEPNGPDWLWKVEENFAGMRRRRSFVIVPDTTTVDYTDLVEIDPATLPSSGGGSPFPARNPITVSTTPPVGPAEGDIWFDIST